MYEKNSVAYNAGGNLLWTKIFNSTVNGDDYPTDIEAGINGDFYVAGTSAVNVSSLNKAPAKASQDFTLLKYSPKFICSVPENLVSDSITSFSALLRWNAEPEALRYTLQYRVVGSTWISVNTTANIKNITGLRSKTKYQWRVKTICSKNPEVSSDFSAIEAFYTIGSPVAVTYNQSGAVINTNQKKT